MNKKYIQFFAGITALIIIGYTYYNLNKSENLVINLQWHQGPFIENEEDMKTGLAWALSSLGAELPTGSLDSAMTEISSTVFALNLSLVGFSTSAEKALQKIVTEIKLSEAYQANDYVEMGRLVMLTLNSSFHYYEITGAPKTLDQFKAKYRFQGKICRVINSAVSQVPRRIDVAEAGTFDQIAYISIEGSGSFEENTFEPEEYEVMDFMPNGQLRFALYDQKGYLKQSANSAITAAGKPSKCLWCHETTIQPFFTPSPVLDGTDFLSAKDFLKIRGDYLTLVSRYRTGLDSDVDFTKKQDHALMERIYLGFMEPSKDQLVEEWGLPEQKVKEVLADFQTHAQEEFKFDGLYDRVDIDRVAPYKSVLVPTSTREFSENELNFFSSQK